MNQDQQNFPAVVPPQMSDANAWQSMMLYRIKAASTTEEVVLLNKVLVDSLVQIKEIQIKEDSVAEEIRGKRQDRKFKTFRNWTLFIAGFTIFAFGFTCLITTSFAALGIYSVGLGSSLMGISALLPPKKNWELKTH